MLGKLIKYDIRATWRDFATVYISIFLAVLFLPLLFNNIRNTFINAIAVLLIIGIVVATIAVMIMTLFKIFNTNIFSKQGYLTMTLPVSSTQVVLSKLLVSSMWIILTGIVSSIGILVFVSGLIPGGSFIEVTIELGNALKEIISAIDGSLLTIILVVISMILATIKEISKLFFACSIAHIKQLKSFRVPAGVISYFVFSWIESLIAGFFSFVATDGFIQKLNQLNQIQDLSNPTLISDLFGLLNTAIGFGFIITVFSAVAYAIGTIWIVNRKLDLD
jgi:hypothetical protein